MIITFLVRSRAFDVSYHRFYSSIEGAFNLAYMINEDSRVIEFKCLFDEVVLDEIPASRYKPSKLVRTFDYTKE